MRLRATLVDEAVAHAFSTVTFMLAHPFCLGDPALVERAVAANRRPLSPESEGPDNHAAGSECR
jgi:hypothetical protein